MYVYVCIAHIFIYQILLGYERPNMRDLHDHVVLQYAVEWERLGLELGLQRYHITNISENNAGHPRGIEVCCAAVLKLWLREVASPTWGKLDDVIRKIVLSPKTISVFTDTGGKFLHHNHVLDIMCLV